MSFKVMLAHSYNKLRVDNWKHVVVEPKVDGVRVIVTVELRPLAITYYSRNGRTLHMFEHLNDSFREMAIRFGTMLAYAGKTRDIDKGVMFDGEMTAKTFGDISGAIHRKDYTALDAKYQCFHAMPLRFFEAGKDECPQFVRQTALQTILEKGHGLKGLLFNESMPVDNDEQVWAAYYRHRKKGHEGTMVKILTQPWIGTRTHAWMKIKGEETLDLKVVGIKEGTGKYKGTCGAIIVDHKGVEVPVSGMLDTQRHQFWKERKGKNSIIGRTVEVEFQEITVHGSLRHPRFKRIRDDKGE